MRSTRKIQRLIVPIAGASIGFVGGKLLNRIPQVQQYGHIAPIAKIVLAFIIGTMKGKISTAAGVGLGVAGASELIESFLPGEGNGSISGFPGNFIAGNGQRSYFPNRAEAQRQTTGNGTMVGD